MGSVIDQDKNYRADFGNIFRSSAIFYKPPGVETTITVSNYWDFKNSLQIGLMFSIRDMKGKLVVRHVKYFEDQNVLNFRFDELDEGSVEVEAFGSRNLRIPYAAVMAIYETSDSVSMVHSYGRNHSLTELEDGNSLTSGRGLCAVLQMSKTRPSSITGTCRSKNRPQKSSLRISWGEIRKRIVRSMPLSPTKRSDST